jgi:tetratricopeptide (TPR) repeat protein
MTQAQLGEPDWSPSYMSLVESGRRPASPAMLAVLAQRLGCSTHYLTTGEPDAEETRLSFDMTAAEMALRSGDGDEAVRRYASALDAANHLGRRVDARAAKWGVARGYEMSGLLDPAIDAYEELHADQRPAGPPHPLRVLVALLRCYREAGDLSHAIQLGEDARADLPASGGDPGGAIELLSTLAGCYYERGDFARAAYLTRVAVRQAEALDERRARGAAYWNASLVAEARGDLGEALALSEQALALYAEEDDARSIAMLRVSRAYLLLRLDPPDERNARKLLTSAAKQLGEYGTEVERAYCETQLARCDLLRGDPTAARRVANRALERLGGRGRIESARVHLVLADAELALGDRKAGRDHQRRAAQELSAMGAIREAAAAWRELAVSLEEIGRTQEAIEAYAAAADCAGVPAPAPRRQPAGEDQPVKATAVRARRSR